MELTQDGQHIFIDVLVLEDYSKWNLERTRSIHNILFFLLKS